MEMEGVFLEVEDIWLHNIYLDALKYEKKYEKAISYFQNLKERDAVSYCLIYDILCF